MNAHFVFTHPDFEKELFQECALFGAKPDRVAKGIVSIDPTARMKHKTSLVWARDEWPDVEIIEVESVAKAAAELRSRSKFAWTQFSLHSHRRGELIELSFKTKAKLDLMHAKKKAWPEMAAGLRVNPGFALISESSMAICQSPRENLPGGDYRFEENKDGPPSRAYLKLWEWGWRTSVLPSAGQMALDLGASPGGWTWVLAKAGLSVHAFDRSELKLDLPKKFSSRIQFSKGDAFQVTPEKAPKSDWVFCDVIAEPNRTVQLIEKWMSSAAGLVFTVKFKGATDFGVIHHLAAFPGATLRHLNVNRHEITFWREPLVVV